MVSWTQPSVLQIVCRTPLKAMLVKDIPSNTATCTPRNKNNPSSEGHNGFKRKTDCDAWCAPAHKAFPKSTYFGDDGNDNANIAKVSEVKLRHHTIPRRVQIGRIHHFALTFSLAADVILERNAIETIKPTANSTISHQEKPMWQNWIESSRTFSNDKVMMLSQPWWDGSFIVVEVINSWYLMHDIWCHWQFDYNSGYKNATKHESSYVSNGATKDATNNASEFDSKPGSKFATKHGSNASKSKSVRKLIPLSTYGQVFSVSNQSPRKMPQAPDKTVMIVITTSAKEPTSDKVIHRTALNSTNMPWATGQTDSKYYSWLLRDLPVAQSYIALL